MSLLKAQRIRTMKLSEHIDYLMNLHKELTTGPKQTAFTRELAQAILKDLVILVNELDKESNSTQGPLERSR